MLNFSLPTQADRADVLAFYEEFEVNGGSCIGFGHRKDYDRWRRT